MLDSSHLSFNPHSNPDNIDSLFCMSMEVRLRGAEQIVQDPLLLSGWATLHTPESSARSMAQLLSEGYGLGVTSGN